MGDTSTDTTTDNPGDLRNQLSQAQQANKEQAARIAAFEADEQLREAGFSHLSRRQRATIIRDLREDGKDLTPETAADMAKEHGYPLTATPTTDPTTNPTTNGAGQGNGQGNGQSGDQGNGQQGDQDQDVEDSLTAMDLMRRAQQIAAGNAPQSDFEQEIRATKNKEELTDLIRTKGARNHIVHEWDVP